jgi:WD40 repeat protein
MTILFEGDSRDGVTSLVVTTGVKPVICSGHYDFIIRLWCIETRQLIMTLDGESLFPLLVCTFFSLSLSSFFVGHSDYVGSVATWRGPEPIFISGSSDGTLKAWSTQTGALVATGEGHTRDIWAVAVTFGHRPLIVSGSFDRTLKVWDIHPVLHELNWQRRKVFCLFLNSFFRDRARDGNDEGMRERERELMFACDLNTQVALSKVFYNQDLCTLIAACI